MDTMKFQAPDVCTHLTRIAPDTIKTHKHISSIFMYHFHMHEQWSRAFTTVPMKWLIVKHCFCGVKCAERELTSSRTESTTEKTINGTYYFPVFFSPVVFQSRFSPFLNSIFPIAQFMVVSVILTVIKSSFCLIYGHKLSLPLYISSDTSLD